MALARLELFPRPRRIGVARRWWQPEPLAGGEPTRAAGCLLLRAQEEHSLWLALHYPLTAKVVGGGRGRGALEDEGGSHGESLALWLQYHGLQPLY